jgi:hypothetical protein
VAFQVDQCYATDQYGGFTNLPVSGGGTGYFRIGQIGDRWTFVSPEGNAFLYKGIMVWNPQGARVERDLTRKYGTIRTPGFYTPYNMIRYSKMLGINMLGWGLPYQMWPISFQGTGNTVAALGVGWPMLPNHGPAQVNVGKTVKDILRTGLTDDPNAPGLCPGGVKKTAWTAGGNRRAMVDLGDPNYTAVIQFAVDSRKNEFALGKPAGYDIATHPDGRWLFANAPDDADPLFGHKGGLDVHVGWVACVTSPIQRTSEALLGTLVYGAAGGTTQEVYAKTLAREWLRNKYGTIQQLNAAWNSTYTTWDSSNPSDPMLAWQLGNGTGFLDEDGVTHPWIRVDQSKGVWQWHYHTDLRLLPVNVRNDLNAIDEHLVETLFNQYGNVFRAEYPNHLLMSPSAFKHSLGDYKPHVLRAAGRVFDYLQMDYNPNPGGLPNYVPVPGDPTGFPSGDTPASLERSYNLARKPIMAWQSVPCHDSAALRRVGGDFRLDWKGDPRMVSSQEAKGGLYQDHLRDFFAATGDDGKKFWLGFDNWNPIDQQGEGLNWGFSSEQDNAYDGRETDLFGQRLASGRRNLWLNTRYMITDATGHPTTRWANSLDNSLGMYRLNYGNCFTGIRAATRNAELQWLSLVGAEEPPVTGRTVRHGGATRVGGRIA